MKYEIKNVQSRYNKKSLSINNQDNHDMYKKI